MNKFNDNYNVDFGEQNNKYSLSKLDHELFKEDEDILTPVFHVKKINMPNKEKKWKVLLNNKVVFLVESVRLTKSESSFLETPAGFNFILKEAKAGTESFNIFKKNLMALVPRRPYNKKKMKKSKK